MPLFPMIYYYSKKSEEKLSNIRVAQGNLGHPCLLILLIYTKKQQEEVLDRRRILIS